MDRFSKGLGKKKILFLAGTLLLSASLLTGCGNNELRKVKVGGVPKPSGEQRENQQGI